MLLSVETSSSLGGLCIIENKKILGETFWGPDRSHSETLTEEFQKLLKKVNIAPTSITEVLCSHGPGSFTGLRVGLNFAKSICYVNKIQLILTPSFRSYLDLDIINNSNPNKILVLVNAFKKQLFCCDYLISPTEVNETISMVTLTPKEILEKYKLNEPLIALGDGFQIYKSEFSDLFKSKLIFPNLKSLNPSVNQAQIYLSYDHCLKFQKIDPLIAEPLYIKKSEAEESLSRGQLKIHKQRKL